MSYDEFDDRLKSLNLNKKEFAQLVKMSYTGVTNWKQVQVLPGWVDSWLINYEKAKAFDELLTLIKKYDKIKDYK